LFSFTQINEKEKNINTMKKFLVVVILTCMVLQVIRGQANQSINYPRNPVQDEAVRIWEEDVIIPTYPAGEPDPNPMFYFGRVYQGAEGKVYPYPLYDKLTGIRRDKSYKMVYLENEYIKIGILPEIGGRIFSALDKTNNYNFIYTQHVVKPALIGMLGAWISGGMEWNIPHHHRASSFLPVQYCLTENPDYSKTVWVGELELRHRTRWAVGYTMRPGKSYIEITVRIFNNSPFIQSVLCFANTAVHANDKYQVIFPPSTQFVTHHSKREFTTWPVATTRYGGADFTKGVDVSWYKNHYNSNSMFAWNYTDDFIGGYDHGKNAGIICFADHNTVPGKKFWTWGNGPSGKTWDQALTDDDGPYIELMVGAYSDNQPDYSWMQPDEVKDIKEFWYPVRGIGGSKNANNNAAINVEYDRNGDAVVGIYTTGKVRDGRIVLKDRENIVKEITTDIRPDKPFSGTFRLPGNSRKENITVCLYQGEKELISYREVKPQPMPMPEPVIPPPAPEKISSNEELYLAGRRIDQFHNPALEPDPYWDEALKRDSLDTRVNIAMGIRRLKKAQFAEAEKYLRRALIRLTAGYTIPQEGEANYYLGVALKAQDKPDQAYVYFYKSIWSEGFKAAGYRSLAAIDCQRGDFNKAHENINFSVNSNAESVSSLILKASILRHMKDAEGASEIIDKALSLDPLNVTSFTEKWLINDGEFTSGKLLEIFNRYPEDVLETALFYYNSGLWEDAVLMLKEFTGKNNNSNNISPLVYYYLGYFTGKLGRTVEMKYYYDQAAARKPDYVFPFQYEAVKILRDVIEVMPDDAMAYYYLGNLLYDWQPAEAIRYWEKSAAVRKDFSIVHRNLALGYANFENDLGKAIKSLEQAVASDKRYAMHFFELDELYQAAGISPDKRLAVLEKNHDVVNMRDDALSHEIALLVFTGKCNEALRLMKDRRFNVWEGGARFNVNDYWTDACMMLGHAEMGKGNYKKAIEYYRLSIEYPSNLQTARGTSSGRFPEASWWSGVAYNAAGDSKRALKEWNSAVENIPENSRAFSVSNESMNLFYQAVSLRKLGQEERAAGIFNRLISSGNRSLQNRDQIDFFAKFGQQQSQRSSLGMTHFVIGLGYLGLGRKTDAETEFRKALEICPDHLYSKLFLENKNWKF
jgi:tetratricopeptide (TPR) repeat protein